MKKQMMTLLLAFMVVANSTTPTTTQAASKVKLNKTSVSVKVGKTITLKVKGTTKKVSWSSKNKKIATVSKKGVVKGKKAGTTYVYAKVNKKSLKCKVKVTKVTSKPAKPTSTPISTKKPAPTPTNLPTTIPSVPKNDSDVKVLTKIIEAQVASGATISTDLNDSQYVWNDAGRIVEIKWNSKHLSGNHLWQI